MKNYYPCENKDEDDECTLCNPGDDNCDEEQSVGKTCQSGSCQTCIPKVCGEGFTLTGANEKTGCGGTCKNTEPACPAVPCSNFPHCSYTDSNEKDSITGCLKHPCGVLNTCECPTCETAVPAGCTRDSSDEVGEDGFKIHRCGIDTCEENQCCKALTFPCEMCNYKYSGGKANPTECAGDKECQTQFCAAHGLSSLCQQIKQETESRDFEMETKRDQRCGSSSNPLVPTEHLVKCRKCVDYLQDAALSNDADCKIIEAWVTTLKHCITTSDSTNDCESNALGLAKTHQAVRGRAIAAATAKVTTYTEQFQKEKEATANGRCSISLIANDVTRKTMCVDCFGSTGKDERTSANKAACDKIYLWRATLDRCVGNAAETSGEDLCKATAAHAKAVRESRAPPQIDPYLEAAFQQAKKKKKELALGSSLTECSAKDSEQEREDCLDAARSDAVGSLTGDAKEMKEVEFEENQIDRARDVIRKEMTTCDGDINRNNLDESTVNAAVNACRARAKTKYAEARGKTAEDVKPEEFHREIEAAARTSMRSKLEECLAEIEDLTTDSDVRQACHERAREDYTAVKGDTRVETQEDKDAEFDRAQKESANEGFAGELKSCLVSAVSTNDKHECEEAAIKKTESVLGEEVDATTVERIKERSAAREASKAMTNCLRGTTRDNFSTKVKDCRRKAVDMAKNATNTDLDTVKIDELLERDAKDFTKIGMAACYEIMTDAEDIKSCVDETQHKVERIVGKSMDADDFLRIQNGAAKERIAEVLKACKSDKAA